MAYMFGIDSILRELKRHYLVERFYPSALSQRISLDKDSVFSSFGKARTTFNKRVPVPKTDTAYYSDICVGAIACRLEKKEGGSVCVYIMTLGVLAPYRGLGIGSNLLNYVLDLCVKQNIGEIYLHVQTNNEEAINFYKKFGFEITDTIQNYYKNITPPDCYVVTKLIDHPEGQK